MSLRVELIFVCYLCPILLLTHVFVALILFPVMKEPLNEETTAQIPFHQVLLSLFSEDHDLIMIYLIFYGNGFKTMQQQESVGHFSNDHPATSGLPWYARRLRAIEALGAVGAPRVVFSVGSHSVPKKGAPKSVRSWSDKIYIRKHL